MKQFYFVLFLIVQFALSGFALAQDPIIDNAYTLVGKQRVSRVLYDFTYKVNIINDDTAIKNVSATVSSSSENTTIIDNNVDFNDLAIGETSASIDTFTLRQDRRHPFDPAVLNWEIDFEPDVSVPNIEVDTSPSEQTFSLGEFQNIATSVNFTPPVSGNSFTITIAQTVTPNSGLNLSPNVNGTTFNPSANFATTLNQEITPSLVGEYEITTTATIVETGESATAIAKIIIVTEESKLIAYPPSATPEALSLNSLTSVFFTARISGEDLNEVDEVFVREINTLMAYQMEDTGQNGDLLAGDFVYSGSFSLDSNTLSSGDCFNFITVIIKDGVESLSNSEELCVSKYPVGFQTITESEIDQSGFDTPEGTKVSRDIIKINVKNGTSDVEIDQIVSNIGGVIIGSKSQINRYQIKLLTPPSSLLGLVLIITDLQTNPNIESADLTYFVNALLSLVPTDTNFNDQAHLSKIRADEAWYISRGTNKIIAIIDSGVDLDHLDLKSKIIKGKDFIDGDMEPDDLNGHGTHVAGIAAGITDNGIGISGVAWDSKILAVRVLNAKGSSENTDGIADGISYAANQGAHIINISAGYTPQAGLLCKLKEQFGLVPPGTCLQEVIDDAKDFILTTCQAVEKATNKNIIVVAAAGNDGIINKGYPAACPTAIAVGATTSSDAKASFSQFGSWVDIAAPGVSILSTIPPSEDCILCDIIGFFGFDELFDGYATKSGTSMASPIVAGAAAVVWSRSPELTNLEVEERLKKTAKKLPGLNLGAGRIDLFEAVFNGSFEEGNLALWKRNGTVASFDKLGPLTPQDRKRMGYVSTGPAGAQTTGGLTQSFTVQAGVTTLPITFTYAFISEEFPEFVGTQFDDSLKISLKAPNGTITELATESINSSSYSAISGLDFPGGDSTVGWTGWKTVTKEIPITAGAGEYQIILEDAGDAIYDTVLLIDHIQFKK